MSETPLSGGVEGKAARKGRSMLRPFSRRSVVWEGWGGGEEGGEGWRDVGCGFGGEHDVAVWWEGFGRDVGDGSADWGGWLDGGWAGREGGWYWVGRSGREPWFGFQPFSTPWSHEVML